MLLQMDQVSGEVLALFHMLISNNIMVGSFFGDVDFKRRNKK